MQSTQATRLLQKAILSGNLNLVRKYLPEADILDTTNYGPKTYNPDKPSLDYRNVFNFNSFFLTLQARQVLGDTEISNSVNGQRIGQSSRRSKFRLDVCLLLLEKARQFGIVNDLLKPCFRHVFLSAVPFCASAIDMIARDHIYRPGISEYFWNDLYLKDPSGNLMINQDSYSFQLARAIYRYHPQCTATDNLGQELLRQVKQVALRDDHLNGQLAIAAPYKTSTTSLVNYMKQIPDPIRKHIINFLRDPADIQRIRFPLIVRELQLPVSLQQQAIQLLDQVNRSEVPALMGQVLSGSPLVQNVDNDIDDQVEAVYDSYAPFFDAPVSPLVQRPSPAHLSIISESPRSHRSRSPSRRRSPKKCPPGKEMNPKTGRCRVSCKADQVRDPITGRCRKSKRKSPKPKRKLSPCPKGQVRDRVSKECRPDRRLRKNKI